MKTKFSICLCFVSFLLFSQKEYIIEQTVLECTYNFTVVKDTSKRIQINTDIYTLRIGKNVSQFYNQTYQNARSLSPKEVVKVLDKVQSTNDYSLLPGAKTPVEYLYKNYPDNKITTTSILMVDPFLFEEKFEEQQWIIEDSLKEILNYSCQKATCSFRGRHWTVWFTPDIPISDGPWKFRGLPGLIMEAYDASKHYHYVIIGLQRNNLAPITFYSISNKKIEKTERKTFLKAKRKLWDSNDPNRDLEAATGIDLSGGKASAPREKKTNYEFIERDYR